MPLTLWDFSPSLSLFAFAGVGWLMAWGLRGQDQLWRGPERGVSVASPSGLCQVAQVRWRRWLRAITSLLALAWLLLWLHGVAQIWAQEVNASGLLDCGLAFGAGVRCAAPSSVGVVEWSATWVWAACLGVLCLLWRLSPLRRSVAAPAAFILLGLGLVCVVVDGVFRLPVRHLPSVVTSLYNLMALATAVVGGAMLCSRQVALGRWLAVSVGLPPAWAVGLYAAVWNTGLVFGAVGMFLLFAFFVMTGMPMLLAGWMWVGAKIEKNGPVTHGVAGHAVVPGA